jgi:DNA primase
MFNRLKELTGSKRDVAQNQARMSGRSGQMKLTRSAQKPSLLRRVIALLLQYPHLVQNSEWRGIDFSGLNFAGRDLLEDLLRVIALEKPENSAILLESYRGSVHERVVMALSVMELNVPEGGEDAEFSGAVAQLMRQVRQEKLNELLLKEGREGLDDGEKWVLTDLLRKRL